MKHLPLMGRASRTLSSALDVAYHVELTAIHRGGSADAEALADKCVAALTTADDAHQILIDTLAFLESDRVTPPPDLAGRIRAVLAKGGAD